jgi:hypothetical protein
MAKFTIVLKKDKDCQGSVRFATPDKKALVTNVYVSRQMAGINEAQEVTVTVEVGKSAEPTSDAELLAKLS